VAVRLEIACLFVSQVTQKKKKKKLWPSVWRPREADLHRKRAEIFSEAHEGARSLQREAGSRGAERHSTRGEGHGRRVRHLRRGWIGFVLGAVPGGCQTLGPYIPIASGQLDSLFAVGGEERMRIRRRDAAMRMPLRMA